VFLVYVQSQSSRFLATEMHPANLLRREATGPDFVETNIATKEDANRIHLSLSLSLGRTR